MNFSNWRRTSGEWFDQMRQEMDQLMHRFMGQGGRAGQAGGVWRPDSDLAEGPEALVLKVDLPGVDPQDLEIAYAEGALVLRGERKEDRSQAGVQYHCAERPVGRFYRSIPLPADTDPETIQANWAKGVLTVTVPKKPSMQERKIHIHSVE